MNYIHIRNPPRCTTHYINGIESFSTLGPFLLHPMSIEKGKQPVDVFGSCVVPIPLSSVISQEVLVLQSVRLLQFPVGLGCNHRERKQTLTFFRPSRCVPKYCLSLLYRSTPIALAPAALSGQHRYLVIARGYCHCGDNVRARKLTHCAGPGPQAHACARMYNSCKSPCRGSYTWRTTGRLAILS